MSAFDWQDVLMDEAEGLPVDKPTEDLPSKNEEKPEDNGWDSPAAGDLPEDDDPNGMKDVPNYEDPISGNKPGDYDNLMNELFDEDENEGDKGEEKEEESEDEEEPKKGDDKSEDEGEEKGTSDEYVFDSFFYDEAEGLPMDPVKEDLPSDNEKEGEDNGWDSPAAGDLPEDDTDPGMKDVPRGEDPITGTKSTQYDDLMTGLMDEFTDEDDSEKKEDDSDDEGDEGDEDKGKKKEQGEDEGSDDDGASDDEAVEDFADFFVDSVGEETPDADGADADLEPADPVDGDGKKVDPIGDPDLPSNLTEPVLVPADDPQYATKDELMDVLREDVRFSFGDF
jgi:hypothetical protein